MAREQPCGANPPGTPDALAPRVRRTVTAALRPSTRCATAALRAPAHRWSERTIIASCRCRCGVRCSSLHAHLLPSGSASACKRATMRLHLDRLIATQYFSAHSPLHSVSTTLRSNRPVPEATVPYRARSVPPRQWGNLASGASRRGPTSACAVRLRHLTVDAATRSPIGVVDVLIHGSAHLLVVLGRIAGW